MGARRRFDVAVVGPGAAGCVMAARLSESGARSVVLLEAGPASTGLDEASLRDGRGLPRPPDWGYATEPDEQGNVTALRRSRLVGGTSWLTRFALRGSPADFDRWASLGNAGWAFDDVLPAFRRLEADADFGDRPWHGASGPMPITRYRELEPTDVQAAIVEAAEQVGFARVEDHNEPGAVGVGRMAMSSVDGVRVTTADAYLPAPGTRSNLVIRTDAHVAEVSVDGSRAVGVRLVDGTVVEADRVVLCAGTYGSPAILLRSGIGPAGHLGSLGIAVRLDLPGVGENLSDHPATDLELGYAGPARTMPLLHTAATFRSRSATADDPPDLMLWITDPDPPGRPTQLTIGVVLLKPRSRGRVRLRSSDPADAPRIRPADAVANRVDLDRLVEGYERALAVASEPAVSHLCGSPVPPASRDALVRRVVGSRWSAPHVVGTCAMGPSPADGAVVDAAGRSTASTACSSPMPRSCRRCHRASRTSRRSWSPSAWRRRSPPALDRLSETGARPRGTSSHRTASGPRAVRSAGPARRCP